MNLTETAREIVKEVAETQRKSFQAGRARVKQVTDVPTSHLVPEGVDAYRDIMKYNLKTQSKLGDKVLKTVVAVEGFPVPMKDPADRFAELALELAESQARLVDSLCDVLIKAYPEKSMEKVGEALGDPVCKLRDATKQLMKMEMDWVEKLLKMRDEAAKKSAPRPSASRKKSPTKSKARKPASRKPSARKAASRKKASASKPAAKKSA